MLPLSSFCQRCVPMILTLPGVECPHHVYLALWLGRVLSLLKKVRHLAGICASPPNQPISSILAVTLSILLHQTLSFHSTPPCVVACTCIHFFRASRGISKFYSFVHRNYQPFVASQLPLLTEKCQHRHDGKLSGCLVDGPPARRLRAQQHAACTTSLLHARSCPRVRRWTTICRAAPALFERAHGEGPEENQVHRADGECDSLFHRSLQASSGTKMGNATFKSAITSLHQWTGRPRET